MGQMFSGPPPVPMDFNTDPETLGKEIAAILERTDKALDEIQKYEGKPGPIREAIAQPKSVEANNEAAVALSDNVSKILGWYQLAEDLAKLMFSIGAQLQEAPPAPKPGLVAGYAKLMAFIYRFDSAKMMQPAVQNDFSGYRRVLGKVSDDIQLPGDQATASIVSMFVAENAPFTSAVAKALTNNLDARHAIANVANTCAVTLDGGRETAAPELYLDAMVSGVVLYDRASNSGVFTTRELSVRKCISAIKKRGGSNTKMMLNAIKFSTVHFSEAPAGIQRSLE